MPRVRYDPEVPVFELQKTGRVVHRSATVDGWCEQGCGVGTQKLRLRLWLQPLDF
jgi:hypothetical protein